MVDLLKVDRVKYVWDEETGDMLPLCYLYFCKYCLDIRSAENVRHEVDSHFCSQSLDGITSTEAVTKKNKSATSWDCPSCHHTLSMKATTTLSPSPSDTSKQLTKKTYYQVCSFCRWSSRDVGMEDRATTSGGWAEKEIPNLGRINDIIEYYKYVAHKETVDSRITKKRGSKSLAMQFQHKYGGTKSIGRKPHPASPMNAVLTRVKEQQELKQVQITPSVTFSASDLDPLPEDIFTRQIDFAKISSIEKRLAQPEHQHVEVGDYCPTRSMMFVKRSLRCKQCEHNLIKPEYHPSSIKFKMQLVAIQYLPEVRIHKQPELKAGERTKVTLVLINRSDHARHVTLMPLVPESLNYSTGNSKCELPASTMLVSQYQEAEFGAVGDTKESEDDPGEIAFRDENKLGFYVWVTPDTELGSGDSVWISFSMKYDHKASVMLLPQTSDKTHAAPEVHWLSHKVFVNLGKV